MPNNELHLLLEENETVPDSVKRCAQQLADWGIWCQFSRNLKATSCLDAARKRNRLGHTGIPLWDELKSYLGEYYDEAGKQKVFLAHCRGDRELDLNKVALVLQGHDIRRASPETAERIGAVYGTVNPILISNEVMQIFDSELQRLVGVPGTIMTNAGDHTWAVEFDPFELISRLPNAQLAEIVQPQTDTTDQVLWGTRTPETIGILTGNPPDAGLTLWDAINKHYRQKLGDNSLGDVSTPKVIIVSAPEIGISMEMDRREAPLRKALLNGVDTLCQAGAKIIAHPAHTTHYFAPEMSTRATERGARFISIAEATMSHLRSLNVQEVALLGTRYVTDLSLKWSVYANAFAGIKVHQPSPEGWKRVLELGYEVQQKGPTTTCLNMMRDLLRKEVPTSCQHVVLAMTEFSPVLQKLGKGNQGKTLIDPVDIYGEAIVKEYLGSHYAEDSSNQVASYG